MADDDWESKNFDEEELPKAPVKPVRTDKWEGEDEEEPSKDNWDDDDESKPAAPAKATEAPKKKKNRLAEAIAEKERKQHEKNRANMTPEELAVEKIRQLKMQEEMELQMVKSTFGSMEVDTADPMTKDDFDALRKKIVMDLRRFEKRAPFEDFLEDFIQDLCLSLPSKRLKQVKTKLEALYFEKNKAEKATTSTKGKAKAAGKVKLAVESELTNVEVGYELDDYDDFM